MDDGRNPDPASGGSHGPVGPPPVDARSWRHPSELGSDVSAIASVAPPPLHRGVLIGTALATLLVVVGITRLLMPGTSEDIAVVSGSFPVPATSPGAGPMSTVVSTTTPDTVEVDVSTAVPTTSAGAPSDPVALVDANDGPDHAVAVAVQNGALYITSSAAVGDSRSVSLSIGDAQVDAGVVLVDESIDIAVLHVDDTGIDLAVVDDFVDRVVAADEDVTIGTTGPVPAVDVAQALDAATGRLSPATWLGLDGIDVPSYAGVKVTAVADTSPAALAGLQVDDVIVGFVDAPDAAPRSASRPVNSLADLALDLAHRDPGDVVGLVVRRGSESVDVRLMLTGRPGAVTEPDR